MSDLDIEDLGELDEYIEQEDAKNQEQNPENNTENENNNNQEPEKINDDVEEVIQENNDLQESLQKNQVRASNSGSLYVRGAQNAKKLMKEQKEQQLNQDLKDVSAIQYVENDDNMIEESQEQALNKPSYYIKGAKMAKQRLREQQNSQEEEQDQQQQGSYYIQGARQAKQRLNEQKNQQKQGSYYIQGARQAKQKMNQQKNSQKQGSYYIQGARQAKQKMNSQKQQQQQGSYYVQGARQAKQRLNEQKQSQQQGSYYIQGAKQAKQRLNAQKQHQNQESFYVQGARSAKQRLNEQRNSIEQPQQQQGSFYIQGARQAKQRIIEGKKNSSVYIQGARSAKQRINENKQEKRNSSVYIQGAKQAKQQLQQQQQQNIQEQLPPAARKATKRNSFYVMGARNAKRIIQEQKNIIHKSHESIYVQGAKKAKKQIKDKKHIDPLTEITEETPNENEYEEDTPLQKIDEDEQGVKNNNFHEKNSQILENNEENGEQQPLSSSKKIMEFIKGAPSQIAKKNSQSFQHFKQQQSQKFEESQKSRNASQQNINNNDNDIEDVEFVNDSVQRPNNENSQENANEYTFKPQQLNEIQDQQEQHIKTEESNENFQSVFNKQNSDTKVMMLDAIEMGDLNLVKEIVRQFNFDPNEELGEEGCGQTCIHFATFFNKKDILQFFIFLTYRLYPDHFIDIMNLQTQKGNTALLIAFELSNEPIIKLLFQYGGLRLSIKNSHDQSAFDLYDNSQDLNLPKNVHQTLSNGVSLLNTNEPELSKSCPTLEELLFTNSSQNGKNQKKVHSQRDNDSKAKSLSSINKGEGKGHGYSPSKSYTSNKSAKLRPIANGSVTKLNQYKKQKQDLKSKLNKLNDEIVHLEDDLKSASPEKPGNYKKRFETSHDQNAKRHANDLIHKMKMERQERELKHKEQNLIMMQKMQEQLEESKQRQLDLKRKMIMEKQKQIQDKIELQKKKKMEQKQFNLKANEVIKELKKNKNFDAKIKQKHEKEVEMPELERRKQILSEKRKLYQPPNYQEIHEHSKKHDLVLKQKMEENQKERILQGKELPHEKNFFYKPSKSSFMEKMIQREKELKEKEENLKEEKKQLVERRKKYGELVKDIYQPQNLNPNISNLSNNIDPLSPASQSRKDNLSHTPGKDKKVFYLSVNSNNSQPKKQKQKMFRYHLKPKKKDPEEEEEEKQQQIQQQKKNKSPLPEKKVEKVNYIQQLRKMREKNQQSYKQENWNKFIENDSMDLNDKYSYVVQSTNRIENLAQMKELSQQQDKDMESMQKVNDLYIDSIKAKLALLDKIKQSENNTPTQNHKN